MPNSCPSLDELERYSIGEASQSSFDRWDEHIAACVHCQAQLEYLAHKSEPLCTLVAEAAKMESPKLPTDLRTALEQIRQNGPRHKPLVSEVQQSPLNELAQIREYRILACIGEGGMGCVYHAYDTFLQRAVAIKVLRRERLHKKEAVQRFMREMEMIGKLEHPSIVKALAAGEQDGLHFLVMEYISGVDTYQLRRTLGTFSIADSCEIVLQTARALDYAHGQQVLHRDIKPSNLIINSDGNVILLDLGLAQLFGIQPQDQISKTDQAIGTLTYMAPEQLAGLRGHSIEADIFSLGATLCEYLTGQKLPLRNANNDLFSMISDSLPELPTELFRLLRSMVANSPKDRPKSMREVVMRIASFTLGSNLVGVVDRYKTKMLQASVLGSEEAVVPPPVQSDVTTEGARLAQSTPIEPDARYAVAEKETMADKRLRSRVSLPRSTRNRRAGLAAAALLLIALPPVVYSVSPWGPFTTGLSVNDPSNLAPTLPTTVDPVLPNPATPVVANKPAIAEEETGTLEISVVDEIPRQLTRDGRVQIENLQSQKRFTLQTGDNVLPLGDYRIVMNGPEELETIENISIASGAPQRMNLSAVLKQPFQYPKIPTRVGESCTYHGTIQINPLLRGTAVGYTLRLKIIGTETDPKSGSNALWLNVEALTYHSTGDLTENAYLKIDTETWEHDKRLKVLEGWIVGSSKLIEQYMEEYYPQSKTKDIVVRFDPREDLLKKKGAMVLPTTRVSLHDFLVLFFGDESILAANDIIKKLRPELPTLGNRNTWIDTIDGGRGPIECYVVSSMDRNTAKDADALGFFMARSKRANFGFVELRVSTPLLKANCVVKNSDTTKVDAAAIGAELERIRTSEIPAEDVSLRSGRFDLATLPEKEGDSCKWAGTISIGTLPPQIINATVTALNTEQYQGVEGRWFNIEVNSAMGVGTGGNWENAYVLVDTAAYKDGNFKLLKGWVAAQDPKHVFAIPADMNLDAMIDQRITLLEEPGLKFIGVPEVMSMLFGAQFTPNSSLSSLRGYIGAVTGGNARKVSLSEKTLRNTKTIKAQTWEPPDNNQLQYKFTVSKEVPFSIVDVEMSVKSPAAISIKFALQDYKTSSDAPFPNNPFIEKEWLALAQTTQAEVEDAKKENWRVWEWNRSGKVFKVYAEYGGIIYGNVADKGTVLKGNNGNVLLKNRAGQLLQVSLTHLLQDDLKSLDEGRFWPTAQSKHKWFHVEKLAFPRITLRHTVTNHPHTFSFSALGAEDQDWVLRLNGTTLDSSSTNREIPQDMQFSDYVR